MVTFKQFLKFDEDMAAMGADARARGADAQVKFRQSLKQQNRNETPRTKINGAITSLAAHDVKAAQAIVEPTDVGPEKPIKMMKKQMKKKMSK